MQPRVAFGKRRAVETPPPPAPAQIPEVVAPAASSRSVVLKFYEGISAETLRHLALRIAEAQAKGAEEVVLAIASPGGELLPTLELHRVLLDLPIRLKTHAVGRVASAATFLFLSGSERSADPSASFMFHEVSTQLRPPTGSFVARSVERHRQLYELTAHEVYRARTRLPPELIARFATGEVVLDTADALAYGVIHHIGRPNGEAGLTLSPSPSASN